MFGGRKVRSNKGKKRVPYGPRSGKTRSGKRFSVGQTRKVGRKTRSNKGKKRTPYGSRSGKTRSGRNFRGGNENDDFLFSGKNKQVFFHNHEGHSTHLT